MKTGTRIWIYRQEGAIGIATHYADRFPLAGYELLRVETYRPMREFTNPITGTVHRTGTDRWLTEVSP